MINGWSGFWGLIQIPRSLKVVMPWIFSRCQERWRRMERDMDGGRANDIFFHGYPVVPGLMVLSLIHFCCVFHPRFLYAFRWCSQFTGHCFFLKWLGLPPGTCSQVAGRLRLQFAVFAGTDGHLVALATSVGPEAGTPLSRATFAIGGEGPSQESCNTQLVWTGGCFFGSLFVIHNIIIVVDDIDEVYIILHDYSILLIY